MEESQRGPGPPYAAFWRRLIAVVIDFLIVYVALFLCAFALRGVPAAQILGLLFGYFTTVWLYFALFESSQRQATPGKLALGIKVTDSAGYRIGFGQATARALSRFVSAVPMSAGYLVAAFNPRHQGFHDMIADTLVVTKQSSPEQIAADEPADSGNTGAVIVFVVVGAFGLLFFGGILAAIAIPAYQSYTARAQVAEGLALAEPFKYAVDNALQQKQTPNAITSDSLELTMPTSGKFVQSIKVTSGAIAITFGNNANLALKSHVLVLMPALKKDDSVVWICGHAAAPEGATPVLSNPARFTGIADRFLPANCRK